MRVFILGSFLFLGVSFYELSGGADFQPEVRTPRLVETVTRSDTDLLTSLAAEPEMVTPVAAPASEPAPQIIEVTAPLPTFDTRRVSGAGVNMRVGPGTGFGVMDTLMRDTTVELLEVSNGWAHIRLLDGGRVGWISARFLDNAGA